MYWNYFNFEYVFFFVGIDEEVVIIITIAIIGYVVFDNMNKKNFFLD